MQKKPVEEEKQIPSHVAIIMDGNRRWAVSKGLSPFEGHRKGAENVRLILEHAKKLGIKYVTLFAFSSENWNRSKEEVKLLVDLFRKYLKTDIEDLQKEKVRIRFIGDRMRFDEDIRERMNDLERETESYDDFHVIFALSYGARGDLISAIKRISLDVAEHKYLLSAIDENTVNDALSTRGLPYPDLVIRTSGEQRLSNFPQQEIG